MFKDVMLMLVSTFTVYPVGMLTLVPLGTIPVFQFVAELHLLSPALPFQVVPTA